MRATTTWQPRFIHDQGRSHTAHAAIIGSQGFGGTIRSINGALECDGRNPATVANRVATYQRFAQILGVNPGGNLSC
jgi:hypothetical protein